MILRRVIEHVQAQNWFAVGVDFVIVVVGVVIGIQAANWNEERQLAAQERSYLGQLRDEILGNHGVVDLRMRYNSEVVAAGERALAYLDGDGDCESGLAELDTAAMLRALHADPALHQQLRFWLGQSILAEAAYPGMPGRGEVALAAVSGDLGTPRRGHVR